MKIETYRALSQRQQAYLAVRLLIRQGALPSEPRQLTAAEIDAITESDVKSLESFA